MQRRINQAPNFDSVHSFDCKQPIAFIQRPIWRNLGAQIYIGACNYNYEILLFVIGQICCMHRFVPESHSYEEVCAVKLLLHATLYSFRNGEIALRDMHSHNGALQPNSADSAAAICGNNCFVIVLLPRLPSELHATQFGQSFTVIRNNGDK